jgi:glycosyltransferase involved in cell wall biosynthesis/spore maturation protein CgeB
VRNAELAYARLREDALRYRERLERAEAELRRLRATVNRLTATGHDEADTRGAGHEGDAGNEGDGARASRRGPWSRLVGTRGRRRPATPPVPAAPQPAAEVQVTSYEDWRRLDPAQLRDAADAAARAGARLRAQSVPLGELRVAAILDDFTAQSFGPDCRLLNLTAHDWAAELESFQPHLLFVESVWRGQGGSWRGIFPQRSEALTGILAWCREHEVPKVFWNKEDPVHFQYFIRVADEFDHVFTTDVDRVADYMLRLGHDRVHFLPFGAQPRRHHPVETGPRRHAAAFAGAYYAEFPTRRRDLEQLVAGAARVLPVEIFDRNHGSIDPAVMFPEEYRDLIVGTLGADEIDLAYKGYDFGLTLNTIKTSQTMFARRVLELLLSNTPTLSNYARALRVLLGDLVPLNDSAEGTESALRALTDDPNRTERLRALGLRRVLREHTSRSRLEYVVAVVTGTEPDPTPPVVTVVVVDDGTTDVGPAVDRARAQQEVTVEPVVVRPDDVADRKLVELLGPDSVGLAVFHPADWYGDQYLRDLVDALAWTDADVVGKAAYHRASGETVTRVDGPTYRPSPGLAPRRALVVRRAAAQLPATVVLADAVPDTGSPPMAVHPFDYCESGAGIEPPAEVRSEVDVRTGITLADLRAQTDPEHWVRETLACPVVALGSAGFHPGRRVADKVVVSIESELLVLSSTLPAGQRGRVFSAGLLDLATAWPEGRAAVSYAAEGALPVELVVRLLDADRAAVGEITCHPNANREFDLPAGATHARLVWRVHGPGRATIGPLLLRRRPAPPPLELGSTDLLVVANRYPTYADLYRNGFVHSRVRRYLAAGLDTEVFEVREGRPVGHAEFEGVEVTSADSGVLAATLATGRHRTVAIHFLDQAMWDVVTSAPTDIRFLIWAHGAEIQPWWRRKCVYEGVEDMGPAQRASDARMTLWSDVFSAERPNVEIVFVSHHLADTAQEDLGHRLAPERFHVIANPIDTDIFRYRPKDPAQRHRILSIRPYASRIYANDLAVAAVLDLRGEPWFDELSFLFVGDGPLFEETVAPLRDLPNVTLRRTYLRQAEIAELHREYGVMLIPSRGDTHGVSRDEAMASGLVPVTNAVGAVPEFVGDREGFVVPPEDHRALADAIRELHRDPDGFLRRSAAAAARIRQTTSADEVITRELAVIQKER